MAEITGIRIESLPDKTEYLCNEDLELTGLRVFAMYDDDTEEEIYDWYLDSSWDSSYYGTTEVIIAYEGYQASFEVEIIGISEIFVSQPPNKTQYIPYEDLELDGLEVSATMSNGSTMVLEPDSYEVDTGSFSPDYASTQSIYINHYDSGCSTYFDVEVMTMSEIQITKMPDQQYFKPYTYADLTGIELTAVWPDGRTSVVSIDDCNYDSYINSDSSPYTIYLYFSDITVELEVEIMQIVGLVISGDYKKEYMPGEPLDTDNIVVSYEWSDGSLEEATDYSLDTYYFDEGYPGYCTINVTDNQYYQYGDFEVYIMSVQSIQITPKKTLFANGEYASIDFFDFEATYENGETGAFPAEKMYMDTSEYSYDESGEYEIKFSVDSSYGYGEGSVWIQVVDISGIHILQLPYILQYEIDQKDFDETGLRIGATSVDGEDFEIHRDAYSLDKSAFQRKIPGTYEIGISALGYDTSFQVTVLEDDRLEVVRTPSKLTYYAGEELNKSGIWVKVYREGGTTRTIYDYTITHDEFDHAGQFEVTVSRFNVSDTFTVTVIGATLMEIVTMPDKLEYGAGEEFDPTGLTLKLHYEDGTSLALAVEKCTISKLDTSVSGNTSVTVSYGELSVEIACSVLIAEIDHIEITTEPSKKYYAPDTEQLDITGMVVTAILTNGEGMVLEEYEISEFQPSVLGHQTITVTYEEFTASFEVTVGYEVIVNGGSGSGFYRSLDAVKVIADVPEGMQFAGWMTEGIPQVMPKVLGDIRYKAFSSYTSGSRNTVNWRDLTENKMTLVAVLYRGETLNQKVDDNDGLKFIGRLTEHGDMEYGNTKFDQHVDIFMGVLKQNYIYFNISSKMDQLNAAIGVQFDDVWYEPFLLDRVEQLNVNMSRMNAFVCDKREDALVTWILNTIYFASGSYEWETTNEGELLQYDFVTEEDAPRVAFLIDGITPPEKFYVYKQMDNKFASMAGLKIPMKMDRDAPAEMTFYMPQEWQVTLTASTRDFVNTATFVDWDGTVLKEEVVRDGGAATPPDIPARPGYKFYGWDTKYDKILEDVTITAQYDQCVYTVRFLNWNGTVLKTQSLYYGESATAPTDPEREECDFIGWDKDFSFITESIDVTAVFEIKKYTVTFLGKDGFVICEQAVESGSDAEPPEPPVVSGFVFQRWIGDYTAVKEDVTIKSEYVARKILCVRFVDFDGTLLKLQHVGNGMDAFPPTNPTRDGYIFVGWDKTYKGITKDETITALYSERTDSLTVRFIDWDGTLLKTETVAYGNGATPPTVPIRSGYSFFGWNISYDYITEDTEVQALYRAERNGNVAEIYRNGNFVGKINMALDCSIIRRLNGECSIELKTATDKVKFVKRKDQIEFGNLIFDLTNIVKEANEGFYTTTLKGEHISYILNDDDYKVDAFEFSGKPKKCLAKILKGTPFSVGVVDFSEMVSLKVNQEDTTRRDVLMQLVALCKGEIEYDGYSIGIRKHIGNNTPIELMGTQNVRNVGMSYSRAEHTETYEIELYKKTGIDLGDEIHIVFHPLGLDKTKRISGIEWNPYNFRTVKITVGGYKATINDSLYREDDKQEQIDELKQDVEQLDNKIDDLTENIGDDGLKVISCKALPDNPDNNTIYLIQGEVVMK